jgi:hypothetical protein
MTNRVTLLGIVPKATAPAQLEAVAAIDGPPVFLIAGEAIAAIVHHGEAPPPAKDGALTQAGKKALLTLHRRLEQACLAGPILPADPVCAISPEPELAALLADQEQELAVSVATAGRKRQWDITIAWPPESVLAPHRQALAAHAGSRETLAAAIAETLTLARERRVTELRTALAPVALDHLSLAPGECAAGLTILTEPDQDAAITAALGTLPDAGPLTADMRGPMPPVSFTPIRLAAADPASIATAWHGLALPDRADRESLSRAWRRLLPGLHPDHGATESTGLQGANAAYRLLRGLLPRQGTLTLRQAQKQGALRLKLPGQIGTAP